MSDITPKMPLAGQIVAGLLAATIVLGTVWLFNWNWVRGQMTGMQQGWDAAVQQCLKSKANCVPTNAGEK